MFLYLKLGLNFSFLGTKFLIFGGWISNIFEARFHSQSAPAHVRINSDSVLTDQIYEDLQLESTTSDQDSKYVATNVCDEPVLEISKSPTRTPATDSAVKTIEFIYSPSIVWNVFSPRIHRRVHVRRPPQTFHINTAEFIYRIRLVCCIPGGSNVLLISALKSG